MIDFIEEIIAEAEQAEIEQRAGYYDLVLVEIRDLTEKIDAAHDQAERELAIIRDWELRRCLKLQERIEFMERKLEAYLRETGNKTLDLPNGVLKIRRQPDRVEVSDLATFLQHARSELLSIVPETLRPDLGKIKDLVKRTGEIPEGVSFIDGTDKFSYKLRSNHDEHRSEEA